MHPARTQCARYLPEGSSRIKDVFKNILCYMQIHTGIGKGKFFNIFRSPTHMGRARRHFGKIMGASIARGVLLQADRCTPFAGR